MLQNALLLMLCIDKSQKGKKKTMMMMLDNINH